MSFAPADRPNTPLPPVSEPLTGTLDNRFRIAEKIGAGGMAIVYRADDLQTGATVAVKVLRQEIMHSEILARFDREVKITSGMKHPGILEIIATGHVGSRPYYVMPFVAGKSLRERLEGGQAFPIPEAVRIATRIGEALAHAHARGVMHRDIKPANILLDADRVILADFGIARAVDIATADKLTESGVALGTAHYMSPEQAAGDKVDSRTDIYSLGCVLYEMLVGTPPFSGSTTQQVLARHATSPVPGMREVRGTIAVELEDVVLRCLAKLPADRYPTADAFLDELLVASKATAARRTRDAWYRRPLPLALAAMTVAAVAWIAMQAGTTTLDPRRLLVLPLVNRNAATAGSPSGEDAATILGAAIDGIASLRWVDGWRLLDASQRRDPTSVTADVTRMLARRAGTGRVLSGWIVTRGDSCDVHVELRGALADSVIARGQGTSPASEAWRGALTALNKMLPELVGTGAPAGTNLQDRSPKAVAAYLEGERAYRRIQMRGALGHFREALGLDSLLTIAALRGAQAALWAHEPRDAGELARIALTAPLSPRDAHFARGLAAYVEGNADTAAAELRRAVEIDPQMTIAWMQLAETFTHLLPREGSVDSAAAAALSLAYGLDSSGAPGMFHLAERAAREGNVLMSSKYLEALRAASPDSSNLRQIELMHLCIAPGGRAPDWADAARTRPVALLFAATKLAAGGAQLRCAVPAFQALLAVDTANTGEADGRRFQALMGLVSARHALGQPDSAVAVIDRFAARWGYGSSLLLRQTFVSDAHAQRAQPIISQDSARFGADFRRVGFSNRLWLLGVWSARNGRVEAATGAARELSRRADSTKRATERRYAQSVQAHIAMARRDTAAAIALLEPLLGAPTVGDVLQWEESVSMADERLLLARILLARGNATRALAVANVFDSQQPAVFLMYLVPSLELRAQAARALGDDPLAKRFEARVTSIRAPRSS